mgnify:CR=1 FL=1
MATLQQVIQLVFEGVDNASETAKSIGAGLNALSASAEAVANPFAELAEQIELTAAVIGGMAGIIGTVAVKAATQFSSALSDLDRFLQDGEGSANDYKSSFQDLAVQYGISANDIARSTSDWSAANFKIQDALSLTGLALQYAVAGQLDAATATDLLKKLMSGLNVEQEKTIETLSRWGDLVNFVADKSKADFKELAIAVSGLSPSFSTSGASAEEFVAIINSSVELFQSGSQAADGLRVIIGQISKPTKDAQAALADFGITLDDAGVIQGSFYQAMTKIADKWPVLTDEQKKSAAATLVSSERADQFKNIMDTWPRSTEIAAQAIKQSTGSIAIEVDRALKTAEVAFSRFEQSVNNLLTAIGEKLTPATLDVTDSLTQLAQSFQKLVDSGALKPLFDILDRQGAELAKTFRAIAQNLPDAFAGVDLSPLASSLENLGVAFSGLVDSLFGNVDLTTVEGLRDALQSIVNVGTLFVNSLEGIIKSLKPFAESIRGAVTGFAQLDEASRVDFGQFIGTMKVIITTGPKVAAAILLASEAGIEWARSASGAFGVLKAAINTLQITFDLTALGALKIAEVITEAKLAFLELTGGDWIERNRLKDKVLPGIRDSIDSFAKAADRNAKELKDGWALATDATNNKLDSLADANKRAQFAVEGFAKANQDAGNATKESVKDYDGILAVLNKIEPSTESAIVSLDKLKNVSENGLVVKGGFEFSDEPIKNLQKTWDENGNPVFTAIGDSAIKATGAFKSVGDSASDSAKKVEEITKKADEYKIKMEEIASNERIKIIEASVQLNVAELESQTKRVEAAFKSIDTTIGSTGDLLGSLFGSLSDADSFTQFKIESQIKLENERRQQALDLQRKLTEAEIEKIQAQKDALDRGDGIIKIYADGLEPEIKAFMFKILKLIRIETSRDVSNYLLGLNPA